MPGASSFTVGLPVSAQAYKFTLHRTTQQQTSALHEMLKLPIFHQL
jgi:hypothetical protein